MLHTLSQMQLHLSSDMPIELRLLALSDVAEGLEYLHSQVVKLMQSIPLKSQTIVESPSIAKFHHQRLDSL